MLQRVRDELAANALVPERSADIHASNEPLVCELERFFAPKTDRADEFCLAKRAENSSAGFSSQAVSNDCDWCFEFFFVAGTECGGALAQRLQAQHLKRACIWRIEPADLHTTVILKLSSHDRSKAYCYVDAFTH